MIKKAINILAILFFLSFLVFAVLILRPVPSPSEEECLVVEGMVGAVYESGVKDISIALKDHSTSFYINRGLENGLTLDSFTQKIIHQKVTIKYPDYWTPLDADNSIKHVSKIYLDKEVVYSEID